MKIIMLCILAVMPTIVYSQSFEALLNRLVLEKPYVLDLKGSFDHHSKMKLADKKITGIIIFTNCEAALKEVSINVKLNNASRIYKIPCNDGFYDSLGLKTYIPTGGIFYNQITKMELDIQGPMLIRWTELIFDKTYNKDMAGTSFANHVATLDAQAQQGLYVHSRRNMDEVDSRMFGIRKLAAYPSLASLKALQARFLYAGEFYDDHLKIWSTINSKDIYAQLLAQYTEEDVANLLILMHDSNENSRLSHEVMLPVLKALKSAAGLSYALLTEAGHLPDPGLNAILAKPDARVFVEKQKAFIIKRIFSEFNEYAPSKSRACKIFEKFPQTQIFASLMTEKEDLFCVKAMISVTKTKSIPEELKPYLLALKPYLALSNYSLGHMELAIRAFGQVKSPDVVPMLKSLSTSTKVPADIALLAKQVLDSYAK